MDIFVQRKLLIRLIIVLVAVNLLVMGAYIWRGFSPPPKPENRFQENTSDAPAILERELNLTPDQVRQIRDLRARFAKKEQELVDVIRIGRDSMNGEMFKENTNEERIYALARKIADNECKMELLRFEQAKELKLVCTPEQVKKFDKLVREMRDFFKPDNKQGEKQGNRPGMQNKRNPPKRRNGEN